LAKLLQEDGYGKVVCPDSMEGLLESIPTGGAGLLLLDLDMPFDNCLAIAGSILDHSPDPIPMILISEDKQVGVGRSNDAQAIGISVLLPRPLKIDDALFSKIDELLSSNG
jgi:FixJ family two-component response regulator